MVCLLPSLWRHCGLPLHLNNTLCLPYTHIQWDITIVCHCCSRLCLIVLLCSEVVPGVTLDGLSCSAMPVATFSCLSVLNSVSFLPSCIPVYSQTTLWDNCVYSAMPYFCSAIYYHTNSPSPCYHCILGILYLVLVSVPWPLPYYTSLCPSLLPCLHLPLCLL
jgi:hypothetical protein